MLHMLKAMSEGAFKMWHGGKEYLPVYLPKGIALKRGQKELSGKLSFNVPTKSFLEFSSHTSCSN